jgi:hypothetical protein
VISLDTLRLCRQLVGTTQFTVTGEQIEDTARQVALAKTELDAAIAAHPKEDNEWPSA